MSSSSKHFAATSKAEQPRPKRLRLNDVSEVVPTQLDQEIPPSSQQQWLQSVNATAESWFYTEAIQIDVNKSNLSGDESTKLVSALFVFDSPGYR
jgi:hypothetical protein